MTFYAQVYNFLENMGREKARRELLGLSDKLLDDMGISRQLLEAGSKAYPWRLENRQNIVEFKAQQPAQTTALRAIALNLSLQHAA